LLWVIYMDYSLDSCPSTGGSHDLPAVLLATWLELAPIPEDGDGRGCHHHHEVAERQGETSAE